MLLLPLMDSCFHLDRTAAPEEKRQLAELPVYKDVKQLKSYVSGLENYFNDHFGFRKRLIRSSNRWKRQLASKGGPVGSVCIGLDGWLFWLGENMLENYTGATTFAEQDLKNWQLLLEHRRDWLAARGCRYVFVLAPDKHTVYPEYLPSWVVKSKQPIKLEQFLDYMRANSTVQVIDLRNALIEAKKDRATYLMTDTHWNAYGGFVGYQELMRGLSTSFPDLGPLPLSRLDISPMSTFLGDIGVLLGDKNLRDKTAYSWSWARLDVHLEEKSEPQLLVSEWPQEQEPRSTINPKASRKAILFRDSFSRAWLPYLGQHFGKVIYIWRYYWDGPFLEREKPDVVIDEMLERFLNTKNPAELRQKDNLDF